LLGEPIRKSVSRRKYPVLVLLIAGAMPLLALAPCAILSA
jgi:hypothetical protein